MKAFLSFLVVVFAGAGFMRFMVGIATNQEQAIAGGIMLCVLGAVFWGVRHIAFGRSTTRAD